MFLTRVEGRGNKQATEREREGNAMDGTDDRSHLLADALGAVSLVVLLLAGLALPGLL